MPKAQIITQENAHALSLELHAAAEEIIRAIQENDVPSFEKIGKSMVYVLGEEHKSMLLADWHPCNEGTKLVATVRRVLPERLIPNKADFDTATAEETPDARRGPVLDKLLKFFSVLMAVSKQCSQPEP